ncbi:WxL domain-containing protein [Enterococcus sp. OL5]|uniref:WxL domain-containing protein n=1 Tax=Enterococcus sp. OL5 TaxID=2590214 RepID=UPI001127CDCF|nr:WxL domain-containing protein [Enterococcus sp. OL5]TPR57239.1 WxL domain-containing protein [Enterococcus sp. OL5]
MQQQHYEVTSDQFKTLKINQVVVNNDNKIALNETDENLVNRISEFVDLPDGVSFVEFTQYPDRATLGEAVGKIVLEEQLSTGKMIQKEYEITFTVEPGNLSISQIADFDFGEITKSSREIRTYAKGNEVPRIIIQDYSTLTGWSLNVSATSFSNKKGETIPGATISLKDINPVSTSHKWMHLPEELELNEAGRSLAVMTNPQHVNGLEQGETVIEMGDEKNGELTGVELTIPAHSSIDSDDYSATITWELVTDPTM